MREFYGYALLCGMSVAEARKQTPGFILDCYNIRLKYDARIAQIAATGAPLKLLRG